MQKSKLEEEFLQKLAAMKTNIGLHDRGVIFGFILSLFPIFPSALFGVVIGYLNLSLLKSGKLHLSETSLVRRGLLIGVINTVISVVLLYFILHSISEVGWNAFLQNIIDHILRLFNNLPLIKKNAFEKNLV